MAYITILWAGVAIAANVIGSFTEFTENQLLSIEGASYRSCIQWAWQCLLGHLRYGVPHLMDLLRFV